MSYDICLRGPTCGDLGNLDLPSPTYNLTPIFDLVLTGEPLPNPEISEGAVVVLRAKTDRPRGLRLLSGRRAGDTEWQLRRALSRLQDLAWRERLLALEPENRWGTLSDAVGVVVDLIAAARDYPEWTWEVH